MAGKKEKLVLGGIRRLLNGTARMSRTQAGRLGYYLLSKPRRLPEEPLQGEFLREARHFDFECEDTKPLRAYHWAGDGPSVLLLHGWESSTARWFAFFEPLRRAGFNIYAFDAPAHGRSGGKRFTAILYAKALRSFCRQLGFSPDYWIGHSAGGMAAIYYLTELEGEYEPEQLISMAVPGDLGNFIDKFCEVVGVHDKVKMGIDDQFRRKLQRGYADFSFVDYVQKLRIPGLIVHDEEDDLAPISGARAMHRNWPGSSLFVTRGTGHSLYGEEVPPAVVNYLSRCRGSR